MQPTDPNVMDAEKPRLSSQCDQILERLRQGPATNAELASISLKYTSRVSDLRKNGHDVQVIKRAPRSGLTTYALRRPDGYYDEHVITDQLRWSAIAHASCSSIKYWLTCEEGEPTLYTRLSISPKPGMKENVATITRTWDTIERAFTTPAQRERYKELRKAWDDHWEGFKALGGLS